MNIMGFSKTKWIRLGFMKKNPIFYFILTKERFSSHTPMFLFSPPTPKFDFCPCVKTSEHVFRNFFAVKNNI
jgi:hypothetical protein